MSFSMEKIMPTTPMGEAQMGCLFMGAAVLGYGIMKFGRWEARKFREQAASMNPERKFRNM